MIAPQDMKDLGLPCYDNAQRLARLEERLLSVDKKLDALIEDPCHRCKNQDNVAVLRTEMRVVKWVGSAFGAGFLATLVERFVR